MKSLIFPVLLIASVLLTAFSQVPGFGRCPQTNVVQNFNVQRYLGLWFEIRSYPAIFSLGGSCTQANYGLNPNGTVSVLNTSRRLGQPFSIEGTATLVQPGQGKLIVNFPQNSNSTTPNYFILGTDYDNFAVVHSCSPASRLTNLQFAWVLSRRRTLSRLSELRVENILAANNVSSSPFRNTNQSNCS